MTRFWLWNKAMISVLGFEGLRYMERQETLYEICIYKWKNLKRYKRHAGTGGAGYSGGK